MGNRTRAEEAPRAGAVSGLAGTPSRAGDKIPSAPEAREQPKRKRHRHWSRRLRKGRKATVGQRAPGPDDRRDNRKEVAEAPKAGSTSGLVGTSFHRDNRKEVVEAPKTGSTSGLVGTSFHTGGESSVPAPRRPERKRKPVAETGEELARMASECVKQDSSVPRPPKDALARAPRILDVGVGHPRYRLTASVEGQTVEAMVDTGADVTVLAIHVADRLPGNRWKRISSLQDFAGNLIAARGPAPVTINVGKRVATAKAYRVDIAEDCILGNEVLTSLGAVISCATRTVTFEPPVPAVRNVSHRAARVALLTDVVIAPGQEVIARGSLQGAPTPDAHQARMISSDPVPATPATLGVGRGLVDAHATTVPLRLLNGGDTDLHLRAGTLVAKVELVNTTEAEGTPDAEVRGLEEATTPSALPKALEEVLEKTRRQEGITEEDARDLRTILWRHRGVFGEHGPTDHRNQIRASIKLQTTAPQPVRQAASRLPIAMREADKAEVDRLQQMGLVKESTSPWASPVVLVQTTDGRHRFAMDYRKVNATLVKETLRPPEQKQVLNSLSGARWFTTIGLLAGYGQLPLAPETGEKTAFCTRYGLYQWQVLPFGMCSAPATLTRLVDTLLRGLTYETCLIYTDDIVVYGNDVSQTLARLDEVLHRLSRAGITVKPASCRFLEPSLSYLGYVISREGVKPDPANVAAVRDWPVPKTTKDVRTFMGFAAYYRRFVQDYAQVASPLQRMVAKDSVFVWEPEQQQAFDALKAAFIDAPMLAFPDPAGRLILDTDASADGIGAVLSQEVDGDERVLAYASALMNVKQRRYCATQRELLAVVSFLQHFRTYLYGRRVIIRTDHSSLKWLHSFKNPQGLVAQWLEAMSEFDYEIVHRAGEKHGNADGLSRQYCDCCHDTTAVPEAPDALGRARLVVGAIHQMAEVTSDLSHAEIRRAQEADDEIAWLLVAKEAGERPAADDVRRRSRHARAYAASWQLLEVKEGVLYLRDPAPEIPDGLDTPLVTRTGERIEPPDTGAGPEKYRLLVPRSLRRHLFGIAHGHTWAAHLGAEKTLARLKEQCFWRPMGKDVTLWCGTCVVCQQAKPAPNRPHGYLVPMYTGEPMDRVAIDLLGGLPKSRSGNTHVLVACDYLTKWTEAWPVPGESALICAKALVRNWFVRFGLPLELHSDCAPAFTGTLFTEMSRLCDMKKTKTSSYHARGDGLVERANRTLIGMLRKATQDRQDDWDEHIPYIMSAYRSSRHASTQVTPNYLMFGRELRTPVTLMLPPPTEKVFTDRWVVELQERFHYAHSLARQALGRSAKTQKAYFDKRVRARHLTVGQEVWVYWPRKTAKGRTKKLTPCWDGPWTVLRFVTEVNVEVRKGREQLILHVDRIRPLEVEGTTIGDNPTTPDSGMPEGRENGEQEGSSDEDDADPLPFAPHRRLDRSDSGAGPSGGPEGVDFTPPAVARPARTRDAPQRLGYSQP